MDRPTDLSFAGLFDPKPDHPYFEYHATHPFEPEAREWSPINAAWLADCSLLAYVDTASIVRDRLAAAGLPHASCIRFGVPGPQCFVAHDASRRAIVSFRGTEVQQPADVIADIAFLPAEEPGGHGAVHGGFLAHLDALWPEVLAALAPFRALAPEGPIWFTGHSLGAAMATLAAS